MLVKEPEWEGWYFEDGYLCSPAGDRFTSFCIMACFFFRQMEEFSDVMYYRPERTKDDVLMEVRNRRIDDVLRKQEELHIQPGTH